MTSLAQYIDHTLLKPEATAADVEALVAEALELGTYSVCVSPNMVAIAARALRGSTAADDRGSSAAGGGVSRPILKIAAVAGFPSGKHLSEIKMREAALAVVDGADEVDMVIDVGAAVAGDFNAVEKDIRAVREAIPGSVLKVIIESAVLDDEQIVAVCQAAERAGADFVKTSTGFHPAGGASVHAVELMRATVGDRLGVKASGGIRDRETAEAMIAAGASRLGLSSARAILNPPVEEPRSADSKPTASY